MTKKISEFVSFEENPFMQTISDLGIIRSKNQKSTIPTNLRISDARGKDMGPVFFKENKKKYTDDRDFVRITSDGYRLLASLEKTEVKILSYVFEILEYNKLFVKMTIEDIKLYYGYVSRNPIYSGIIGLLEKDVIARHKYDKSIFFINPLYFYKGNLAMPYFDYLYNLHKKLKEENAKLLENQQENFNKKAI